MHWRGVCLGHLSRFIRQRHSIGRRLHEQLTLGQLKWPPHDGVRLNFRSSGLSARRLVFSGGRLDIHEFAARGVVQDCRRQGHGFESVVQTMGCLSAGLCRVMCNPFRHPAIRRTGSDTITCCSLYKIHPSTYGMFQAAPGRMCVCMQSRVRSLYRLENYSTLR